MNRDAHQLLSEEELDHLKDVVFEREYNDKHPDDYFNAGGFIAHWHDYTDDEREELLKIVRNYDIVVSEVDGDDYGDKSWKYFIVVKQDGKEIYSDYWREKPTREEVIRVTNEFLEK